jgi:homospermidine synthase
MWMLLSAPKMRDPKQLKLSLLRGFVEVDQLIRSGARENRVAWVRHEMNVAPLSKRQANKLKAQILVDGAEAERITTDLARRL